MARPLRVEYAGACYHVINRGNYRKGLFEEADAATAFERTLGEAATRFRWRVHAYAIMRNHFHLALELTEPNLSAGMKWLQGTWIRRHNRFRKLVGRPFQDRFKAILVEPGHAFGQVCHYIHLNPVRAGVVPAKAAAKFPFGSLVKFVSSGRPAWLEASVLLEQAGGLKDTSTGWRKYQEYLEFLAADTESGRELASARLSRGWCLGTQEFREEARDRAKERGAQFERDRYAGLEPSDIRAEREAAWEGQLVALARAAGVSLAKLGPRKSAPEKVLLAAALKQSSSVANGWLAQRLGMGEPASASQFVRRLLLGDEGRRAVERLLSRVKT